MKLYLFGQRNNLGGGTHFGGFTDAIKSLSGFSEVVIEVDASGKKVSPIVSQIQSDDVSVFFFPTLSEQFVKGTIIKWGIFETDTLPEDYLRYLRRSHLIWVPSCWAKNILILHGLHEGMIHVVHEGVDPDIFHAYQRSKTSDDGVFRIFMCGKKETRKGFNELLEGFKIAFGNDKNVELHLKADFFWGGESQAILKQRELASHIDKLCLTNVLPINRSLSTQDMALLYSSYDAMAFPSRAEGWGLPLIEAIACGLPTVTSFYSGHSEYLSAIEGKFIKLSHRIKPISCPEFLQHWKAGGNWAVVDPEEIAEKFLFLRDNLNTYVDSALLASTIIRDSFSWRHSAEQALKSLKSIGFFHSKNIFDDQLVDLSGTKAAI